jgi:hypothetical protein
MKMRLFAVCCAALTVILAAGCGKLDVVATDSVRAFGEILKAASPDLTSQDELTGAFAVLAPDGNVSFSWAADFALGAGDLADLDKDLVFRIEEEPFVDAGLDVEKLPDSIKFWNSTLSLGVNLEGTPEDAKKEFEFVIDGNVATGLALYEQILKFHRNRIGFHAALGHYNIDLGSGNMFEWAKDMGTNDKDIVFVLNPAPFIAAGVDPNKIDGWVFTKVPVMDANGKAIEVDKILKAFNLK